MKESVKKSSNTSYPDEFASPEEKLTKEWAYKYFNAAEGEMHNEDTFNIDSITDRFIQSRKLAAGLRDIEDLKKRFSQNQDLSYLSVNHAVSTPTPKNLKIAARTIYNTSYKPTATPVDSTSVSKAGNKRNTMIHKMNMEILRKRLASQGVDGVMDKGESSLPKNEEELEMHMEMNPKIAEAVGWEHLIRQGFIQNKFTDIQEKVAMDLVNCARGITKTGFDSDNNVIVKLVDPVNFVHSYVRKDDFSDARHLGEIMTIPISKLREMIGDEYGEQDLQWIADNAEKSTGSGYQFGDKKYYKSTANRETYDNTQIKVMNLQVLQYDRTTHVKKGKLNGGFRIERKKNGYKTPENAKREREIIHSGAQVIYEGYWVVGTEYIFQWRRKDEAFKERLNGKWFNTALFDYVVYAPDLYDMTNKSLTETARFHDDQLYLLEMKIQQELITAHPSGYVYNIDAILGAIEGMGLKNTTVADMVRIKAQNGSMYVSSKNQDNELVNGGSGIDPVRRLEAGLGQEFQSLLVAYDKRLSIMKEAIGINDAVDGSQPDKKALVGVQKLAAEAHKSALSDLNKAYQYITRETAKRVYLAFQMQIKEGKNVKELEASLGELNLKEIKVKAMGAADCSIDIEMLPNSFEIETIQLTLDKLVAAGQLPPEAIFSILRIAKESTKKAEAYTTYLSKRFRKEQQDNAEKNIQLQSQGNMEAAQASAQAAAQQAQMEAQAELEKQAQKYQLEKINMETEYEAKAKLLRLETEAKKELIEAAAKASDKSADKEVERTEKKDGGGYDLKKDSISRFAGKVEPSVMPTSVKTGA